MIRGNGQPQVLKLLRFLKLSKIISAGKRVMNRKVLEQVRSTDQQLPLPVLLCWVRLNGSHPRPSTIDAQTAHRLQFEDILQNKGVRTTMIILNIATGNAVICHLMCCFWVLVGRSGIEAGYRGEDNWIENAGFELEDTEAGK